MESTWHRTVHTLLVLSSHYHSLVAVCALASSTRRDDHGATMMSIGGKGKGSVRVSPRFTRRRLGCKCLGIRHDHEGKKDSGHPWSMEARTLPPGALMLLPTLPRGSSWLLLLPHVRAVLRASPWRRTRRESETVRTPATKERSPHALSRSDAAVAGLYALPGTLNLILAAAVRRSIPHTQPGPSPPMRWAAQTAAAVLSWLTFYI